MKQLGKLKLNRLSSAALSEKELSQILGGEDPCCCGCLYEGTPGGSNNSANTASHLQSPGCGSGTSGSGTSGSGTGSGASGSSPWVVTNYVNDECPGVHNCHTSC